MEIRETCVMVFATSRDEQKAVRINEPRPAVTPALVNSVSNMLMGIDVFDDTVGSLTRLVRAEIVTETTRTLI